jgi:hypothetical protein
MKCHIKYALQNSLTVTPVFTPAIATIVQGQKWPRPTHVCETSRLPPLLDNRLTDGGEVVSLTRRPATLYPQEDSWYSFLFEAESTPGP